MAVVGRALAGMALLALAGAAAPCLAAQSGAFGIVADSWKPDDFNTDRGRNYGLGLRFRTSGSLVRAYAGGDLIGVHPGEGSVFVLAFMGGLMIGPAGENTTIRPYGLAALGCLVQPHLTSPASGGCTPVVGAGIDNALLRGLFVEFSYYTRRDIRVALAIGFTVDT